MDVLRYRIRSLQRFATFVGGSELKSISSFASSLMPRLVKQLERAMYANRKPSDRFSAVHTPML